ncbi:hypothetical protein TcCL_NonESM00828 [Trypanosoma cruzi]|nr:hypothetical protein TcCL_NonESM00828 [Trypanosoma cruzi]
MTVWNFCGNYFLFFFSSSYFFDGFCLENKRTHSCRRQMDHQFLWDAEFVYPIASALVAVAVNCAVAPIVERLLPPLPPAQGNERPQDSPIAASWITKTQ